MAASRSTALPASHRLSATSPFWLSRGRGKRRKRELSVRRDGLRVPLGPAFRAGRGCADLQHPPWARV